MACCRGCGRNQRLLWQVVVPKALRDVILQAVHGGKTLCRLHQGFYWGQQRRDLDFYLRCNKCTARKGPPDRPQAHLQQFPVGSPMERVGVSVLGLFPLSERANLYVLSAMDYFTKWPGAYLPTTQRDRDYCGCLAERHVQQVWNTRSSKPATHNFESLVLAAICEKLGSHKTRTTPLHFQN